MAALKQIHDVGSVDAAQALLRQHLARPPGIFDPQAAFAALEHLLDVAKDKADDTKLIEVESAVHNVARMRSKLICGITIQRNSVQTTITH